MIEMGELKNLREQAGLSQQELADKVGVPQQTIEKIENGKVKRTSYLPEISRALEVGSEAGIPVSTMCASDVLRIAASQWTAIPTPEQIIRALAAGGYRIIKDGDAPGAIDGKEIIREIMERRKMTATELANAVGITPSVLNKPLRHQHMGLTIRTVNKVVEWDRKSPNT